MPLVSLIIPRTMPKKYLRRCLNSAMSGLSGYGDNRYQRRKHGYHSPDLPGYEQMDERFHVIDKANTGVSDSRNQAIKWRRKYLRFMDSDDWLTRTPRKVWFTPLKI